MTLKDNSIWYTVEETAHIMRLDYKTALKIIENSISNTVVSGQHRIYDDDLRMFMLGRTIYPLGHYNYID